jgi:hypothetical protein
MRNQMALHAEPKRAAMAHVYCSGARHAQSDRRTARNSRCHPATPTVRISRPAVRMLARNHFGIFTEARRRTRYCARSSCGQPESCVRTPYDLVTSRQRCGRQQQCGNAENH